MRSTERPRWAVVAERVDCPQCHAKAGEHCKAPSGGPVGSFNRPHLKRTKAVPEDDRRKLEDEEKSEGRMLRDLHRRRVIRAALLRNLACGNPALEIEAARLLLMLDDPR